MHLHVQVLLFVPSAAVVVILIDSSTLLVQRYWGTIECHRDLEDT